MTGKATAEELIKLCFRDDDLWPGQGENEDCKFWASLFNTSAPHSSQEPKKLSATADAKVDVNDRRKR